MVTGAEPPGGRGVMTDDNRRALRSSELPLPGPLHRGGAETGFIALSARQRRPLQAGTHRCSSPTGQAGEEHRLQSSTRGGAISGRILDEDGEPMAGAT